MTSQHFNQLDLDARIEALQHAVYLDRKENIDSTIFLYNLDDLYLEVHQHKPYHYINAINIVEDKAALDTYRKKKKITGCSAAYNKLTAKVLLMWASIVELSVTLDNYVPAL